MLKVWHKEAPYIIAMMIVLVSSGLVFDQWLISSLLVASGYIYWLYYRIARLEKWLARGTKSSEVYPDSGLFAEIIRHLYQQKRAHSKRKKSLKQLVRRLHTNISALPDATILLNAAMEIEWCNIPAQYLLRIDRRQDLGQRLGNLIRNPEFLTYLNDPDAKSFVEIQSPVDQATILRIKVVRFGEDQRLILAQNISDQKQLQDTLKNFVAHASHELKTPLTVLSGHLEMLEMNSEITDSARNSLEISIRQTERMKQLVENLLLLSKIESYQLRPDEGEIIDVQKLIAKVMDQFGLACDHPKVRCDIIDDARLRGVKSEIESILTNLIDNAIKYADAGNKPLDISATINDEGELSISVKDLGIGIEASELPHITERYFRGQQVQSNGLTGSGLGLAIVQQVVNKHGARMKINSTAGQGSAFNIIFPSYRVLRAATYPE